MNIEIKITCSSLPEAARLFHLLASGAPADLATTKARAIEFQSDTKPSAVEPEPEPEPEPEEKNSAKTKGQRPGGRKKRRAKKAAAAEVAALSEVTLDTLRVALRETLDSVGDAPVRAIFKRVKIAKLSDLPEASYPAFLTALAEARSVAS